MYANSTGPGGTFPLLLLHLKRFLSLSLSRDFQHLINEASLKHRKVALLINAVMIANKLQYFVEPFPSALQTKGQSH